MVDIDRHIRHFAYLDHLLEHSLLVIMARIPDLRAGRVTLRELIGDSVPKSALEVFIFWERTFD